MRLFGELLPSRNVLVRTNQNQGNENVAFTLVVEFPIFDLTTLNHRLACCSAKILPTTLSDASNTIFYRLPLKIQIGV